MISSVKGVDGLYSSKKLQMFAAFTIGSLMALDSHFSGRVLDFWVFITFMGMSGYSTAASILDKKFNPVPVSNIPIADTNSIDLNKPVTEVK